MSTYDGTELREAIRARLNQRWDSARGRALDSANEYMHEAIGNDLSFGFVGLPEIVIPPSTDEGVSALLDGQADKLVTAAAQKAIKAQMDEVLP